MNIHNFPKWQENAGQQLDRARDARKILLIYTGTLVLTSLLVTVVNFFLSRQISQAGGGLGTMGTRSVLSALRTMLPIVQSLLMMAVEFGYIAAMLRISRGQYASPMSMKMGFERFWKLLRATLLQAGVYFAACFTSFYLAMQVFLLTPLGSSAINLLLPYVSQTTDPQAALELLGEAGQLELLGTMIPLFFLTALFGGLFLVPISYQYRMVNYVLMDEPRFGGLLAIAASKRMMRGNRFKLFRVDLKLWWYHGLQLFAAALCYGDILLPMLGVQLPFSDTVSYYLFYGLFLIVQTAIFLLFRNKVEVIYAQAYESLRPKPVEDQGGVVLGNIFQM